MPPVVAYWTGLRPDSKSRGLNWSVAPLRRYDGFDGFDGAAARTLSSLAIFVPLCLSEAVLVIGASARFRTTARRLSSHVTVGSDVKTRWRLSAFVMVLAGIASWEMELLP
jgi:hypothetical protein